MPMYKFWCRFKHGIVTKILTPAQSRQQQLCPGCARDNYRVRLRRAPSGPSSNAKETLDNGLMTKRLERPADAERLNKERSQEQAAKVKTSL